MIPIIEKGCLNCRNYILNYKCLAFIDGIPLEIVNGEKDHLKPLPNQNNNIVFEPINQKI